MDRIRAERRLEEKARVAAQNAEVRAKKDAAKAKSDAVSLFLWASIRAIRVLTCLFFLVNRSPLKTLKGKRSSKRRRRPRWPPRRPRRTRL